MTKAKPNLTQIKVGRRDYFAAFAMQAMTNKIDIRHCRGDKKELMREVAEMAFHIADAMMEQRRKK